MGPPQPAKGIISIEACARPIAVDHRISLPYYFRIAGTLLRQAKIYRDEKNILDLYVILLRYTSLLCETIPKHRDYPVFKSREPEFVRNANSSTLIDVLNELESLKPVVKQQIFEHNRRGTPEANGLNGIHAANHRTEKNPPTAYSTQPFVGSNNGSLQKFSPDGRHHMAPLPSVQTDRQIRKQADGEFYCAICMETVPGSLKFSVGSCGHAFCSSCVAQYVAAKLVENLTLVECPDPGCGGAGVVEPESCRGIISPDLIGKWELLLCESALGAKKVYCPYKECSAPLLADGEAAIAEAECPHCHRLFCARCAVPWHVDIECGEFQQLGQDERSREDLLLRRLAGQESWQRCPKCQMYVEKSEGCNYIKCRCGYSFCYRCASEVSAETHYCEKCKR